MATQPVPPSIRSNDYQSLLTHCRTAGQYFFGFLFLCATGLWIFYLSAGLHFYFSPTHAQARGFAMVAIIAAIVILALAVFMTGLILLILVRRRFVRRAAGLTIVVIFLVTFVPIIVLLLVMAWQSPSSSGAGPPTGILADPARGPAGVDRPK